MTVCACGDRFEAVHVQALVAQPAVETLDECVFHGLARPDEIQRDAALIGPFVQRLGHEFGAVIDGDGLRQRATCATSASSATTTLWPVRATLASISTLSRLH